MMIVETLFEIVREVLVTGFVIQPSQMVLAAVRKNAKKVRIVNAMMKAPIFRLRELDFDVGSTKDDGVAFLPSKGSTTMLSSCNDVVIASSLNDGVISSSRSDGGGGITSCCNDGGGDISSSSSCNDVVISSSCIGVDIASVDMMIVETPNKL